MVRASRLLRILPYVAGILFAAVAAVGFEISSEAASLISAQQEALYGDAVDVQVFWFQGKACEILPPDGYITNCKYLPMTGVMVVLSILMVGVFVMYGLLRKRVNLLPRPAKRKGRLG
jgi:uncharacterized membrane protein YdbT with pleckstrin-like domain